MTTERSGPPDWSAGSWEGSRLEQLRRSLSLTVRERLQALEALAETSERLAKLKADPGTASGESPEAPDSR